MFARMGLRSLILVMLALVVVLAAPVVGQTDTIQMVVRGNQTINARSCAQLSCAVVVTFAPGTELECSGTTEGDTVNGSDQWVEVAYEGGTVYVHSSLVEPQESTVAVASAEGDTVGTSRQSRVLHELANEDRDISTARWNEATLRGYSVRTPSTWMTPQVMLDDEDYWHAFAQTNGKTAIESQRELLENMRQDVEEGDYDMVLVDPFGTGSMLVYRLGPVPSLADFEQSIEAYMIDTLGAEIIVSEFGSVDAGETLHMLVLFGTGDHAWVADVYYVRTDHNLITIEVDMSFLDAERYLVFAPAVADSIEMIEDSKW